MRMLLYFLAICVGYAGVFVAWERSLPSGVAFALVGLAMFGSFWSGCKTAPSVGALEKAAESICAMLGQPHTQTEDGESWRSDFFDKTMARLRRHLKER